MAGQPDRDHPDTSDYPSLRELETEASALCERIERLTSAARFRGEMNSRESELQLEAASERRAQAKRLLQSRSREPNETRLCRLEQLIKALECSLDYFRPGEVERAP